MAPAGRESDSAARALVFGQFTIVCLGVMGVYLLVGIGDQPSGPAWVAALSSFLGLYGAWLVFVPMVYALVAWSSLHHGVSGAVVNKTGIGLMVFLFLVFAVPLFFHFI